MKKKLVLFMCTLSVIAFAACGSAEVEEIARGEVTENASVIADEEAEEEIEEADEAIADEVAAPAEDETDVEAPAEEDAENGDDEITLGHNDGSKYENDYFAIGCEFDSNWTLENEEQIIARNQLAKSLVDEKFADAFDNASNITDMVAAHSNGMDTVNVGIEKLQGGAVLFDEQTYIEVALPQIDESLVSMGLQNVKSEASEMTFAGETRKCINISADYNGIKVYETLVVVKKKNYMLCVTACTWNENGVEEILGNFYNY